MVQNNLGDQLLHQGRFEEALHEFTKSYEAELESGNLRGQAGLQNSIGGVLSRLERFDDAFEAFEKSIDLGEKLKDAQLLCMAHTAYGKTLLRSKEYKDNEKGIRHLLSGLEINLYMKNKKGLEIITPTLVDALLKVRRRKEALDVYNKAIAFAPEIKKIDWLRNKLFPANSGRRTRR